MARSNRSIHLSVCKISKEVPGNHLASAGGGCILEWAQEVEEEPDRQATTSRSGTRSQTFLVTTSQVVRNSDVTSSAACKADFLPVSWWSTKTFSLNNLPFKEVPISAQTDDDDISLIRIPTEPLHKQRPLSKLRRNEFELDRPQFCHRCKETEIPEASPGRLYCYVMRENAAEKSFRLQCYMMEKDEDGEFFLTTTANKARLRTLRDFDPTEIPIGSPILNENGVVGFLAFGRNDEIRLLSLPQRHEDESQASSGLVTERATGELTRESAEGHSSEDDGQGSTDTEAERDTKENHEDNQLVHHLLHQVKDGQEESDDSQIRTESHSDLEDNYEGPTSNKNRKLTGNRQQPSESSNVLATGEGGDSYNERGENSGDCLAGGHLPPLQRCQSENAITPRTKRKLFKSYSEPGGLPLKSGDYVEQAIYFEVNVRDTFARCLDTTNRNLNQYWLHWAYRQGVSEDTIRALECRSPESHSEAMFQVVPTKDSTLSMRNLIVYLKELDMNDVVESINDLDLKINKTVGEVLESGDIPRRFFTLLDQKPEDKWNQLGRKLGLDPQTLKEIKIHCANRKENPAENVIEMICAAMPRMTIGQFKKHLENIDRKDVRDRLDDLPVKTYLTITDVRDDLVLTRELTSMLNDSGKINTYKDLAEECGIPSEIYRYIQPRCPESPTVQVMKDILGRKPHYTVDELFTDLREMNRLDVVEAISRHFKEEDMRLLKRQLGISDE